MPRLTQKQTDFVTAYVASGNATEAAKRAGYAGASAKQQGHELLQKAHVQAAIEQLRERPNVPEALVYIAQDLWPLAVPIEDLREDPDNLNTHDADSIAAIAGALRRFKQRKPIVANMSGTVIAGNGTLEAARSLGWAYIAVSRFDGTPEELKAYAVADNRTAQLAKWDEPELAAYLRKLEPDDAVTMGWAEDDVASLLRTVDSASLRANAGDTDQEPDPDRSLTAKCPCCGEVFPVRGNASITTSTPATTEAP